MTEAAVINARARIRQLTDLTNRLTDRLSEEARAFDDRRLHEAAATMAETQQLANIYRRESAQLKADPSVLQAAPASDRISLVQATEAFEAVLSRHSRAVQAARIVSEGLVKTIAAEIAGQRGAPSAYSASGQANPGDGRAVALNRMA